MSSYHHKKKTTVLVVDSEPQTYKILCLVLDKENFDILSCSSGQKAVHFCASVKPDIVILDLDLGDKPSTEIIASIREWSQVPIIILSEHKTDKDIIDGLDKGADDYVIKPFNVDVLCARINASIRKSVIQETGESELSNGPLRMDLIRHEVFLNNTLIPLTPKEYGLLRYFIVHCGKMLGHKQILNEVWGPAHRDDTQYLRVFIGQIREKIEKDSTNPLIITTELGIGYRMELIKDKALS